MHFKPKEIFMVKLGQKVRDKITGIEGIAIGRTEWLHGCVRVTLQPQKLLDGKVADTVTIDEPQLDVIAEKTIKPSPTTGPGGPRQNVSRMATPSRR